MERLAELKDKEIRIKKQVSAVDEVYQELKQKAFMTEELLWDLKRNLEMVQREIFALLKDLGKDEKLAYKSGLTVEEVRFAKSLLKKKTEPNGQTN